MANLIEYIQSQVYENSTEDISGSIMQQVLTRMASDEGVVNVHTISGQTPFADYNNAQAARDAVPAGFKKLGLIITYKLSSGWYIDEFIGTATSGWSTASNWKCLGPISVSQNASTGKTTITIGSESFDVATQPVSVSQNTLSIGGNYAGELSTTYDVTSHNSGATFASLEALLSNANLNTLITISARKGGMSIKFVQTSDNKYVQYRLAASGWSTDIHDWTSEDPYFIDKIMQEVNEAIDEHTPIEITGDVTNAPDEEDLTSVNVGGTDILKFKDRAYNPLTYSGMGRKILRRNIVNGVNTLTQSMISDANTIYVIQYDFTLGEDITIPANCVLEFDGGSLSGGKIELENTTIITNGINIFNDIELVGSITNDFLHISWFGCNPNNPAIDCSSIIKKIKKLNKPIIFEDGDYYLSELYIENTNVDSFVLVGKESQGI